MDLGSSSRPEITVAPVVVKPESDSNRASIKLRLGASESISGRAPKVLSTNQKNTVTMKPSRVRSSPLLFREGTQNAMPTARVMAKADKIGKDFNVRPVEMDRKALTELAGKRGMGDAVDGLGGFVLEATDGSVSYDMRFDTLLESSWKDQLSATTNILFE